VEKRALGANVVWVSACIVCESETKLYLWCVYTMQCNRWVQLVGAIGRSVSNSQVGWRWWNFFAGSWSQRSVWCMFMIGHRRGVDVERAGRTGSRASHSWRSSSEARSRLHTQSDLRHHDPDALSHPRSHLRLLQQSQAAVDISPVLFTRHTWWLLPVTDHFSDPGRAIGLVHVRLSLSRQQPLN